MEGTLSMISISVTRLSNALSSPSCLKVSLAASYFFSIFVSGFGLRGISLEMLTPPVTAVDCDCKFRLRLPSPINQGSVIALFASLRAG